MSRIQKALAALGKNKNVQIADAIVPLGESGDPWPSISTGSIILNYLIGGHKTSSGEKKCPGIPRGGITEIYGGEGAGKTSLAIEIAIECQKEGGSICFLDYENAFSPDYARDLGLVVEDDSFTLIQPRHWEEGAEIIQAMVEAGVDLIIVDSVAAMKPKKEIEEGNISETGQIGHLARLMSSFLPKVQPQLKKHNASLVYINQIRSRIKTSKYDGGPDEDTSGGRALKFYALLRIELKRIRTEYAQVINDMTGKTEKQPISNIVRAKNVKCKISKHQGHTSEFVLRYGEGIDNVRSVIDIAEVRKIVARAGAWYTAHLSSGEEVRKQGKEAMRSHFINNPQHLSDLAMQVATFSSGGVKKLGDISDDSIEIDNHEE